MSLSAFAFLFSEFIQYSQSRVDTADQLAAKCAAPRHARPPRPPARPPHRRARWPADRTALARARRLKDAGEGIGRRVLELASHRDKSHRRETRMLGILQFVTTNVWKMLFGVRPPPSRRPRSPIARAREKETLPRTPCEQTARAAGDG